MNKLNLKGGLLHTLSIFSPLQHFFNPSTTNQWQIKEPKEYTSSSSSSSTTTIYSGVAVFNHGVVISFSYCCSINAQFDKECRACFFYCRIDMQKKLCDCPILNNKKKRCTENMCPIDVVSGHHNESQTVFDKMQTVNESQRKKNVSGKSHLTRY